MNHQQKIASIIQEIKDQGFEAICFWFPSYGIGGGGLAFYRLATWLKLNTNIKICYVDYEDGFFSPLLRKNGVCVIDYHPETSSFEFKEKCIIITNSTRAILLQETRIDNKLLFWHWETECTWELLFLMNETQNFFKMCNEKNAMIFHDWSSWDSLSLNAQFEFKKIYLPVFIEPIDMKYNIDIVDDSEIHLAWLGRLVPDKIQSLFYIIDNLSNYSTEKKKILHIIGDGSSAENVKNYCSYFKDRIIFDFKGTVVGDELNEFLVENVDILFAMGTSVLEGAALRIPAAVVVLDFNKIETNEFFWLFQSKDYCCGVTCSQMKRFNIEYSYFRDMMDDIFEYGMKKEYGERCYQYFMENHSGVERAACFLLEAINGSTLTMGDLEKCIKYVPYNHLIVKRRKFLGRTISSKIIYGENR